MAGDNKLQDVIQTSLESLRALVDSNTIIGNPISTSSGTTVIPVSKITLGLATGGLDYASKATPAKQNFGGGGGTGLSVLPVGFLVIKADGSVEMLGITPAPTSSVEQIADLIDRTPELFAKVKSIFKKDNKDKKGLEEQEQSSAGKTEEKADAEEKTTIDVKID